MVFQVYSSTMFSGKYDSLVSKKKKTFDKTNCPGSDISESRTNRNSTFVAVALKEIICVPHRGTILNELRHCPQSKVNKKSSSLKFCGPDGRTSSAEKKNPPFENSP